MYMGNIKPIFGVLGPSLHGLKEGSLYVCMKYDEMEQGVIKIFILKYKKVFVPIYLRHFVWESRDVISTHWSIPSLYPGIHLC